LEKPPSRPQGRCTWSESPRSQPLRRANILRWAL
jgi:hypothetical protein